MSAKCTVEHLINTYVLVAGDLNLAAVTSFPAGKVSDRLPGTHARYYRSCLPSLILGDAWSEIKLHRNGIVIEHRVGSALDVANRVVVDREANSKGIILMYDVKVQDSIAAIAARDGAAEIGHGESYTGCKESGPGVD